jgi:hypothetical protein
LAKRKQIAKKYAGPTPPTAHLSDVLAGFTLTEDVVGSPPEEDMEDEYVDTVVSVSFTCVAFA